jgi:glycosyltransferase involved in cell wall biosynthesis
MPTISVIVPVFNGEKTIQRTIHSILNQSFADFELIVINDGSKDLTLLIIDNIKDPRLKIFSYPNAGLSASRNRGVHQAAGEYISFIDADDLWTTDKLEVQFKALQANPDAAVAYSWTHYIDESDQFLRGGSYISLSGNVYPKLLELNFLENGSNALIRKQALDEVGEFDESLAAAEDWDIFLRLAARYPFVAVPSPQILYRVSVNSMSANLEKQEAATLQVLERAFTEAPDSLQHLKKLSKANIYKYLTFKSLEGSPERQKAIIGVKFLWHTINNDPSIMRRRIIWDVLLRNAIALLFPPQAALALFTKLERRSHLEDLFLS